MDIFQDWSGPVKPLHPHLRRLKIELSDDWLKFFAVSEDVKLTYIFTMRLNCICVRNIYLRFFLLSKLSENRNRPYHYFELE